MKLRAEHLIKKYKSRTVVKDVSLDVKPHCGERCVFGRGARRDCRAAGTQRCREDYLFLYDCGADYPQRRTHFPRRLGNYQGAGLSPGAIGRRLSGAGSVGFPAAERGGQHPRRAGNDEDDQRGTKDAPRRDARRIRLAAHPQKPGYPAFRRRAPAHGNRPSPLEPSPSAPSSSFWTNLLQASTPSPWRISSPSSGSSRIKILAS